MGIHNYGVFASEGVVNVVARAAERTSSDEVSSSETWNALLEGDAMGCMVALYFEDRRAATH